MGLYFPTRSDPKINTTWDDMLESMENYDSPTKGKSNRSSDTFLGELKRIVATICIEICLEVIATFDSPSPII